MKNYGLPKKKKDQNIEFSGAARIPQGRTQTLCRTRRWGENMFTIFVQHKEGGMMQEKYLLIASRRDVIQREGCIMYIQFFGFSNSYKYSDSLKHPATLRKKYTNHWPM